MKVSFPIFPCWQGFLWKMEALLSPGLCEGGERLDVRGELRQGSRAG